MKWRETNWWKVGFFVTLVAFEGARELVVLASNPPPNIAIGTASAYRSSDGSYVTAEGRWERTDGGSALVPTVVSIECARDLGTCILASTMIYDGLVHLPNIDQRSAKFTDTGVEFTDDWPICDNLFVRIDGVNSVTTAVRSSKQSKEHICKNNERRIEMRLGGYQKGEQEAWRKKHFVPLMELLAGVFRVFD